MTAMLPPIDHEAAAAILDELIEAADVPAIAWNLVQITEELRRWRDLLRACEDAVVEFAPWSGGLLELEGLPRMELRGGKDRKAWKWDDLAVYLRRAVIDPENTGELPAPEVVEAVEEALDLVFAVAPLTSSANPRVRALAPVLDRFGLGVDEFCEVSAARRTVQIHGGNES